MLREEIVEVESSWAQSDASDASYREIDRQLRRLAKRRAALDSEEARWLREAEAKQVWRKLGFATALEYLEDVFGYAPRTALERMRVAKELGQLTQLDAKLRDGEINYGVARELSRVMTPRTEAAWLAHARGKNVHDVQLLVSGHKKGNTPDDDKDLSLVEQLVTLRVSPQIEAMLRQTRADLSDEAGHHLDDNALLDILCRRAREPSPCSNKAPPPAYQVTIRRCDQCNRGEQLAGGRWVPLDSAALATAECDCIIEHACDGIDGFASVANTAAADADGSRSLPRMPKPNKRTRRIPTKVRNFVWQRDGGRCRFPGCRATRNCDFHHLEPFALGGKHVPSNLLVLCSGHHKLHHEGIVTIAGTAPDQLTFLRDGHPLVDPKASAAVAATDELRATAAADVAAASKSGRTIPASEPNRFADVTKLTEAKAALRQLGYTAKAAKEALDRLGARITANTDVAALVKSVLAVDRPKGTSLDDALDGHGGVNIAELARTALVHSGYSSPVAQRAVDAAIARCKPDADLATLIREALQRCRDT